MCIARFLDLSVLHAGVMSSRDAATATLALEAFWKAAMKAGQGSSDQRGQHGLSTDELSTALQQAFQQRPRQPTFVSTLQALALAGSSKAEPLAVQQAAKASGSIHAAVLQVSASTNLTADRYDFVWAILNSLRAPNQYGSL